MQGYDLKLMCAESYQELSVGLISLQAHYLEKICSFSSFFIIAIDNSFDVDFILIGVENEIYYIEKSLNLMLLC